MEEDKGLAPGLNKPTFLRVSETINEILNKETVENPKEIAILKHGLVLIDWYLLGSEKASSALQFSEEILRTFHFSEEEIIAINVFFRKKRNALEIIKQKIEGLIKQKNQPEEGVKINV